MCRSNITSRDPTIRSSRPFDWAHAIGDRSRLIALGDATSWSLAGANRRSIVFRCGVRRPAGPCRRAQTIDRNRALAPTIATATFVMGEGPRAAACSKLFEHDAAGAFAHDETVAVAIVGARALLRSIVVARRQGRQAANPASERRLTADSAPPATMTLASPSAISRGRVADRVRPSRTGRDDRMVGSLEVMLDRHMAAHQIDQAPRNEKTVRRGAALLVQRTIAVLPLMPCRPPMPEPINTRFGSRPRRFFGRPIRVPQSLVGRPRRHK